MKLSDWLDIGRFRNHLVVQRTDNSLPTLSSVLYKRVSNMGHKMGIRIRSNNKSTLFPVGLPVFVCV